MTAVYVIFGFVSPWLIWNSYLFYYLLKDDKTFNLIIISQTQLKKYWAYLLILLFLSIYIFFVRFYNIRRQINVLEFWNAILDLSQKLSLIFLMPWVLFILLLMIFWIMFTRVALHYLKLCILALYLYYFQYKNFRNKCYWIIHRQTDYSLYLARRIDVFTKNPKIDQISWIIWPWAFERIERNIYFSLLPYLIFFDFIVQQGQINKIFIVLPWFYLYSLFRAFIYIFDKLFTTENHDLSEEIYGMP